MKAQWHQNAAVAELQEDAREIDPFESAQCLPTMTNSTVQAIADVPMKPISMETPQAELRTNLASLVRREARLFDAGIKCDLKDQEDMSCLACPVSKADDPESPKCSLCRIGCTEEVTLAMLLAQRRERGGGR